MKNVVLAIAMTAFGLGSFTARAFADDSKAKRAPPPPGTVDGGTADASVKGLDGKDLGSIHFETTVNGLLLKGNLTGLPEGTHAIHLHETGKCEPPFKTAGGHFNPGKKKHGAKSMAGMHAGDLPNIIVPAGGAVQFEILLAGVTLGGKGGLLDDDGASVVVHASADDYMTDPSGASGDRIACGVVTATK